MTQLTKLKIWCEKCEGAGETVDRETAEIYHCDDCKGLGYTEIEPLEVNIKQSMGPHCNYFVCYGKKEFRMFRTKQEAIDWCKQKGLRIKNG